MDQQPTPPPTFDTAPGPPLPKKKTNVWLIVGIVAAAGCCPIVILAAILFPVFAQAKEAAKLAVCKVNLTTIGGAFEQYAQKNGGKYPAADKWEAAIEPYLGGRSLESLQCPKVDSGHGYGYNEATGNDAEVKAGKLPLLQDFERPTFGDANLPAVRHMGGRSYTAYYLGKGAVVERESWVIE